MAGPESANNAGAQGAFIPMLTLGIPATPVMAILLGGSFDIWGATGSFIDKKSTRCVLGVGYKYVYRECNASHP